MSIEVLQRKFNLKAYIGGLIQLKLTLQQHYVKFSRSYQVFILLLASMQSAIFVIRPIFDHPGLLRGHADLLKWVMYLARFDLFIIDLLPGIVYNHYFILVLALLVIFEIIIPNALTISQIQQRKINRQYLDIQLHHQGILIGFWLQSYSIYSQLFIIFLKVPFYVLIVHQINMTYNNDEFEYFIIGLIILLFIVLTHLSQLSLFQESVCLEVSGFQTLNCSSSDVLIELAILAQIIIYTTVKNPYIASTLQALFIILISILQLSQVIVLKKFPINAHCYTIIITQSIIFTYTICWLTEYPNLMCIIALPTILTIIKQFQKYKVKIIIEFDTLKELEDIRYFMAQFVNDQLTQMGTLIIIQTSIFLSRHKQQCQDPKCSCQKTIEVDDPKQILYFKNSQLVEIYLKKIRQIYSNFNLSNTDILQYAQLLNSFGQSLMALQYCTRTLLIGGQDSQTAPNPQKYSEMQTYRSLNTIQQNEENFIISKEQNINQKYSIRQGDSLSWLMNLKFETVIYKIKQQLYINFSLQSDTKKQSISWNIQRFLDYEQQNQELKTQIINIIQRKIELYHILSQNREFQVNQIFKILKSIGQIALNLELKIHKQYDWFPSIRQQSIICFFQSELMNNILQASQFASLKTMSEEKLMDTIINSTKSITFKYVNYMILCLDQSNGQLQIQRSSNNLHCFFGYQYDFFKQESNINFLLPIGIIQQHRNLIYNFMQTGKSKYFRDEALSFFREENQFIRPCKIMVDLHHNSATNLGFVAFFDLCECDQSYIFVDGNNVIGGVTQSIFEKVGYTKTELKEYGPQLVSHYKCQITSIIPDFESTQSRLDCKMRFIKPNCFKNNLTITAIQSKNTAWWNKKSNYSVYNVSIQIKSYECKEVHYHIIQIDNLYPEFGQTLIEQENPVILNSITNTLHNCSLLYILFQNTTDMRLFIDETQLLQVHSGFMAPLDSYQSFIFQTSQYKLMYQFGISITNLTNLGIYNNWLIERVWKGYSDMQTSFVQQFTNRYTTQFYINNSLNVLFQDIGYKLQQKNLSFQESLHQMLEYQFVLRGQFQTLNVTQLLAQLNTYCTQVYSAQGVKNPTQTQLTTCFKTMIAQQNGTTNLANTPASIYFQANYFDFHNKFQNLSNTILVYSLNRKNSVESKWIWTWVPFIVACALILLVSCYSYQLYIKYYERFIDLHKHLDNNSLQREIDKYKIMVAILLKDSNILFRYHFDLESKEQQILEQKTFKEQMNMQQPLKLQQRRNRQSSNASLSSTFSFLGFFSFIVIFLIFSVIIQVYNRKYLDQYAQTASFYVTLSDITYILPGLYFQRYLAYTISEYPYLNQTDINDLYSRINFGLQTIQSFQNFLINYDSRLFLSNAYFNDQLSNMNSHGVCDYLPATIQSQVTFYCPLAFQGALTQGYFQSLNYIYHSFKNEQSINNFTKQTSYNLFEVEGAYILMRATQVLQQSLFDSISQTTNDSINITIEISVIYIILMVSIVVLLFTFIVGYYENEFFVVRRSILLLPTQTLFLDDIFERSLRFISLKDGN